MQQQVAVRQGVTCDKGDELLLRIKPRPTGDIYYICNLCGCTGDIINGFYACKNADNNCDFDCCPKCYKATNKRVFDEVLLSLSLAD